MISFPAKVPLTVPNPFEQQAEKRFSSSSPKAGAPFKERQTRPPQLNSNGISYKLGKRPIKLFRCF